MIRVIVIVVLLLIVGFLGRALYYLYHDRGQGTRMVKALAIRVGLSACLLIFLVVSYKLGWIGESGLR
ncbi:MAG: twin transmembrane helix small protein [Betaproteobacteria bacterium]